MSKVNFNVGWGFPFRFNADGRVATHGGRPDQLPTAHELDAAVQDDIHQIVLTGAQERVMLGQFGLGAERYLFNPLGNRLVGFLVGGFLQQMAWFETRVQVTEAKARIDVGQGLLAMDISLNYADLDEQSILKFRIN